MSLYGFHCRKHGEFALSEIEKFLKEFIDDHQHCFLSVLYRVEGKTDRFVFKPSIAYWKNFERCGRGKGWGVLKVSPRAS